MAWRFLAILQSIALPAAAAIARWTNHACRAVLANQVKSWNHATPAIVSPEFSLRVASDDTESRSVETRSQQAGRVVAFDAGRGTGGLCGAIGRAAGSRGRTQPADLISVQFGV